MNSRTLSHSDTTFRPKVRARFRLFVYIGCGVECSCLNLWAEPFTTDEYKNLIPNTFVEMPSRLTMFGKYAMVHGLVFIASTDLEDEELFLNYRSVLIS